MASKKNAMQVAQDGITRIEGQRHLMEPQEYKDKLAVLEMTIKRWKAQEGNVMTNAAKSKIETKKKLEAAEAKSITQYKEEEEHVDIVRLQAWKGIRTKCINCTRFTKTNPNLAVLLGRLREDENGKDIIIPTEYIMNWKYWKMLGIPYKESKYGNVGQVDLILEHAKDCSKYDFLDPDQLDEHLAALDNLKRKDEEDVRTRNVFDGGDPDDQEEELHRELKKCGGFLPTPEYTEYCKQYSRERRIDWRKTAGAYFGIMLKEIAAGKLSLSSLTLAASVSVPKYYNATFEMDWDQKAITTVSKRTGVTTTRPSPFKMEILAEHEEVEYTPKQKFIIPRQMCYLIQQFDEKTVKEALAESLNHKWSIGKSMVFALTAKKDAVDEKGKAIKVDLIAKNIYKGLAAKVLAEHNAVQWDPTRKVKDAKPVSNLALTTKKWGIYFHPKKGTLISLKPIEGAEIVDNNMTHDEAQNVYAKMTKIDMTPKEGEFNINDYYDSEMQVYDRYNN